MSLNIRKSLLNKTENKPVFLLYRTTFYEVTLNRKEKIAKYHLRLLLGNLNN